MDILQDIDIDVDIDCIHRWGYNEIFRYIRRSEVVGWIGIGVERDRTEQGMDTQEKLVHIKVIDCVLNLYILNFKNL